MESSSRRSVSPSGRFCSSSISSSPSSGFLTRPTSPNRVRIPGSSSSSSSVRFSASSNRSITVNKNPTRKPIPNPKKTCMCSPTTHPGSFRCSLHKNANTRHNQTVAYHSNRLYARRSAMTNSLVRIGTVEGDLVRRALAALIRPSSHQQRRRADFQPRPSRLSVMSKADDS